MIFLHEGLGSIAQWKDFPQNFCDQFQLKGLVYDRVGYGKSSEMTSVRGNEYMHIEALDILPTLVQSLNIRNYILLGHSDGASIALIHAAKHATQAVISLAAHVFVEDISVEGIKEATVEFEENERFRQALKKYHGEKYRTLFYAWSDTWQTATFYEWNIEDLLPEITCPVLAIQGNEDQYGTRKQVESIVKKVNGYSRSSMISNCGHAPHAEQEQEVMRSCRLFLQHIELDSA